jgi:hypothetical protein
MTTPVSRNEVAAAVHRLRLTGGTEADLDTLRGARFVVAVVGPWWARSDPVVRTGDHLRGELPESIVMFRVAPAESARGAFWAASAAMARISTTTPLAPVWSAVVSRDDPDLIAVFYAGGRPIEYVIDPNKLPIRDA